MWTARRHGSCRGAGSRPSDHMTHEPTGHRRWKEVDIDDGLGTRTRITSHAVAACLMPGENVRGVWWRTVRLHATAVSTRSVGATSSRAAGSNSSGSPGGRCWLLTCSCGAVQGWGRCGCGNCFRCGGCDGVCVPACVGVCGWGSSRVALPTAAQAHTHHRVPAVATSPLARPGYAGDAQQTIKTHRNQSMPEKPTWPMHAPLPG